MDLLVVLIALMLSISLMGSNNIPALGPTFFLSIILLLLSNWVYGVYALIVRTSPWQFIYKIFFASLTYLTILLPMSTIFQLGFNPAVHTSFASISFTLMIWLIVFWPPHEKPYGLNEETSLDMWGCDERCGYKESIDGDSSYHVGAFISNDPALVRRKLTDVTVYNFKDFNVLLKV